MSLGHGQLGLSDRLRHFHDLMADTAATRTAYLELQPGKALNGPNDPDIWTLSGSDYTTPISAASVTYAGVIRPIVAVQTMAGVRNLTRVERVSDMTTGTWFFDDAALVASGSTDLYVRLNPSVDPDTTTMVIFLLFTYATKGEAHPVLGAEKFLNNDLDTWGGGNPTSWTEIGNGAVQETTIVLSGTSSAKIGSTTLGAAAFDGIEQSRVGINGGLYRVSGYYQTPLVGQSSSAEVRLRCGAVIAGPTNQYLLSDGRNLTTSTEGFVMVPTWGEWKYFNFDFVWSSDTTASMQAGVFIKNTSGGAVSGLVYVDRLQFRRIQRFAYYAPNLGAGSIPEMEIRSANNLFGPKSTGIGSVSILDADGDYAEAFAGLLLLNKPATVYIGGSFPNGAEIFKGDWRGAFSAVTRTPEVTDQGVTFALDDARTLTHVVATPTVPNVGSFADIHLADEGKPLPHVFGETEQHKLKPVRLVQNANGYGGYQYIDHTVPVADNVDVDVPAAGSIKVYPTDELADQNLQGYEITDFTNDITLSNNKTRWQVIRDIRNYRYDRSGNDVGTNSRFVFDTELSGTPADKIVDIDLAGPAYKVAADLQAAFRAAVGGGDTATTVVYSETTHKFTIARSGGGAALNLYMTPATSPGTVGAHKESWKILGYDTKVDKTGATSYAGDEATFTDADEDHIIRIRSGGYRDDASGTICGTANGNLHTPPAAASWFLQKRCNVPAASIDVSGTFTSGRLFSLSTAFGVIFKVVSDGRVLEALNDLQQSGVADLVVDGEGKWYWKHHVAGSTGAREFYDRDFLTWRMWQDPTMVHAAVRVYGDWNGSLERYMTYADGSAALDSGIPIKHGTEAILEINGDTEREFITGGTGLTGNYYARLVGKNPRMVEFSARGRLTDLLIGDKVKLTRSRAFDTTGAITSLAFRIVGIRHNFLNGVSTCTACEDVQFLT